MIAQIHHEIVSALLILFLSLLPIYLSTNVKLSLSFIKERGFFFQAHQYNRYRKSFNSGYFYFYLNDFLMLYLANLFSLLVFFFKSFFIRVLLYNPGLISNNHFRIIVLSCLKSMQKLIRRKSMSIMALHVWLTKMLKTAIFVTDGVNNDLNYSGKSKVIRLSPANYYCYLQSLLPYRQR